MPVSYLQLILGGKLIDDHAIIAALPSFHVNSKLCLFVQTGAAPAPLSRIASSRTVQGTMPPQAMYFALKLVSADPPDYQDNSMGAGVRLFDSVAHVQDLLDRLPVLEELSEADGRSSEFEDEFVELDFEAMELEAELCAAVPVAEIEELDALPLTILRSSPEGAPQLHDAPQLHGAQCCMVHHSCMVVSGEVSDRRCTLVIKFSSPMVANSVFESDAALSAGQVQSTALQSAV